MAQSSTSFAAGALAQGCSSKSGNMLMRAIGWVADQRRIARTAAALSNLSDATLKDIGIERGDIKRVSRYGQKRFPTYGY